MPEYIACIYEGSAEKAIIELLLEKNRLVFSREELIERELIRVRCAARFQTRYLTRSYGDYKIKIIRILDSTEEKFLIKQPYASLVSKIENIYTKPEIEILIIIALNKYDDYKNRYHEMKPSRYCSEILRMKEVKSYRFVYEFFLDIEFLISTLQRYAQISKGKKLNSLYDLVKK